MGLGRARCRLAGGDARAARKCMLLSVAIFVAVGARADVVYPSVAPGYQIQFPRDEGSHSQFKTEWWYVTGWLEDAPGAPLGFQLTFFRSRTGIDDENPSRFALRQVLFGHLRDQRSEARLFATSRKVRALRLWSCRCGGRFARCLYRRLATATGGRRL